MSSALHSLAALGVLCLVAACRPGAAPEAAEEPHAAGRAESAEDVAAAVAVTIDDVPWVGALRDGETREDATRRLLAALQRHDVTATGFVNCGRVGAGASVPRLWLAAGMRLGNHTEHHLDLNVAALDAWLRDARRCDGFLRELTGEASLTFRYPYLHEGNTPERWQAARQLLDELDSPVAHVTLDTSDWILAAAYGDALRAGDAARAAWIADAFIDHVLRVLEHYQGVARQRVGRPVAHVLLLHANALVADHLDRLLERLRAEGVRFVPLEQALADPVYTLPNDYVGPDGISWLYRFAPAAPELAAWDDEEAARLRRELRGSGSHQGLVHEAPAPVLPGLEGADDGVRGEVNVLPSVPMR